MPWYSDPELEIKRNHSSFGICMFKKEKKTNKNNGITQQKIYIYIYLTMFSRESFVTSCAIKSELVYTTSSLNYTHLQNLTRSLAKKKGSWNKYLSGINVWKIFPFSPFNHLLEPRKNKTLSINMNNTNMCISVYHHPSSIVS